MDIVVTVPKTQYEADNREIEKLKQGAKATWGLSSIPSKLNMGDRVYFIREGRVHSSMRAESVLEGAQRVCEPEGEPDGKYQVLMGDYQEEELNIEVKSHSGFRYRWW